MTANKTKVVLVIDGDNISLLANDAVEVIIIEKDNVNLDGNFTSTTISQNGVVIINETVLNQWQNPQTNALNVVLHSAD